MVQPANMLSLLWDLDVDPVHNSITIRTLPGFTRMKKSITNIISLLSYNCGYIDHTKKSICKSTQKDVPL